MGTTVQRQIPSLLQTVCTPGVKGNVRRAKAEARATAQCCGSRSFSSESSRFKAVCAGARGGRGAKAKVTGSGSGSRNSSGSSLHKRLLLCLSVSVQQGPVCPNLEAKNQGPSAIQPSRAGDHRCLVCAAERGQRTAAACTACHALHRLLCSTVMLGSPCMLPQSDEVVAAAVVMSMSCCQQ